MMTKSIMTGISAGVTAGTLAFGLSRKAQRSKKKLRIKAGKALRTVRDLMDELMAAMR